MDTETKPYGEILNLSACDEDVNVEQIRELLPPWGIYYILEAKMIDKEEFPKLSLRFLLNAHSVEEIQNWLTQLQDCNKTTYSIHCTPKSRGKYLLFKQRLQCQHKTRSKNLYDPSVRTLTSTKNTNCPSRMTIVLHAVKERYQGKNPEKAKVVRKMPCEVAFIATHNHHTLSADSLRFRKMSDVVKERLLDFFRNGHSAGTALELIKMDIKLNNEDYEEILADRKYCPTYADCYYLYKKEFKEKFGNWEFDAAAREALKKKLEEFNEEMQDDCARIKFQESDYVICICPPLFKRVHKHVSTCSELVFLISTDQDSGRVLTFLTPSDCGGLPLGIIVTSSKSTALISSGFQLLKEMVGEKIFGGEVEGPKVFITQDSACEKAALGTAWPRSRHLLCSFHVLQSVWKWLIKPKNGIPKEKHIVFFKQFKSILNAPTINDFFSHYVEARKEAINFPNYDRFLLEYWNKREVWAKAYRSNVTYRGNPINTYTKGELTVLEDRIFQRVKAFNVVQIVDFFLPHLVTYYKLRLLDLAHNRTRNLFGKSVPPPEVLEKIQVLDDNLVLVPSKTHQTKLYTVNTEVLTCECFEGGTRGRCKHVDWAGEVLDSEKCAKIHDDATLELMYLIATGTHTVTVKDPCADEMNADAVQDEPMLEVSREEKIYKASPVEAEKEKAIAILANINSEIINFIDRSPTEVVTGLEALQNALKTIESPETFVSHCMSFGSHDHSNSNNNLCVQRSTRNQLMSNVSEGVSQVGGPQTQYILLLDPKHGFI